MRCAFPPYGLLASAPAVAISSWCVGRTLERLFEAGLKKIGLPVDREKYRHYSNEEIDQTSLLRKDTPMRDFLAFRTMVAPIIIQIIFWVGVAACIILGLGGIFSASGPRPGIQIGTGLLFLVLGPLVVRIYCEILIIFFRINETLTEIKHAMAPRPPEA